MKTTRQHPLRHVLFAAVLLAGCSPQVGVQSFLTSFPADGDLRALPVVLNDKTGTVADLELVDAGAELPVPGPAAVIEVLGRPNALAVGWSGGMCDEEVAISLVNLAGGTAGFVLSTKHGFGGCFLAAVPRQVIVVFGQPVSAHNFTLEVVP